MSSILDRVPTEAQMYYHKMLGCDDLPADLVEAYVSFRHAVKGPPPKEPNLLTVIALISGCLRESLPTSVQRELYVYRDSLGSKPTDAELHVGVVEEQPAAAEVKPKVIATVTSSGPASVIVDVPNSYKEGAPVAVLTDDEEFEGVVSKDLGDKVAVRKPGRAGRPKVYAKDFVASAVLNG